MQWKSHGQDYCDKREKAQRSLHRHSSYHKRGAVSVNEAVLNMLSQPHSAEGSQRRALYFWPAPRGKERKLSQLTEKSYRKQEIVNHCHFKSLDFGFICYMGIQNWNMVSLRIYIIFKNKNFLNWNIVNLWYVSFKSSKVIQLHTHTHTHTHTRTYYFFLFYPL